MSRQFLVPILLPADPANPLEAATKQYVDANAGGGSEVEISATEPTDPDVELWYDPDATSGSMTAEMQLWAWEGPAVTRYGVTGQTIADGQVSTDAAPSIATELYVSRFDGSGMIDWSRPIEEAVIGDLIYLQHAPDASSWHRYQITGTPSLAGDGVWTIPVTTESGSAPGTAPPTGDLVYIVFPSANYDTRYVNVSGDTMTGLLTAGAIRSTANHSLGAPSLLTFHTGDFATRRGYIGEFGSRIALVAENGLPLQLESPTSITSRVGGADQLTINTAGIASTVPLTLDGPTPTGTPLLISAGGLEICRLFPFGGPPSSMVIQAHATQAADLALQAAGGKIMLTPQYGEVHVGALAGEPLRVVSSSGATYSYIGFFDSTQATRYGWIGPRNPHMYVVSDAGNHAYLVAGSGYIIFGSGTTYPPPAANEWARFDSAGVFMIGKTTATIANEGLQMPQSGGILALTNSVANNPLTALNKVGAGVASGHDYIHFRNNNTTIGSITRNGTTAAVLYNTSSDYRLKNDLGPINNGLERLLKLRPHRVTWKEDPTEQVMDAFLAHEVGEVVPEAVTGTKDAVAEADDEDRGLTTGEIIPQQLDPSKLVPLLVAAVQQLSALVDVQQQQINALQGRLGALETKT